MGILRKCSRMDPTEAHHGCTQAACVNSYATAKTVQLRAFAMRPREAPWAYRRMALRRFLWLMRYPITSQLGAQCHHCRSILCAAHLMRANTQVGWFYS